MHELSVKQIIWVPAFDGMTGAIHGVGEDGRVYWYERGLWTPLSMRIEPDNERQVPPTALENS